MTTTPPPIAEVRSVRKVFALPAGKEITVLENISLQVNPGEIIALLGPSGSGKSTLMRILTGLVEPTEGQVLAYGSQLKGFHPRTSIVFQNFALFPWLTVRENIAVGLRRLSLPDPEVERRVAAAVDRVGLEGFELTYPKELSGGMKQRVGIARAIAVEPELLCMDEPFSALDVLTAENLRTEVLNLWLDRTVGIRSILFVTHDIREAVYLANRIVILGSHPGTIRLILDNDLPHPRETRSAAFQVLIDRIHEIITNTILPDIAPSPPVARRRSVEALPRVFPGQIIGLLEILYHHGGSIDVFALAGSIGRDFGSTLAVVKAAELLGFANTPSQDVQFTDIGLRFLGAPMNERKQIFREQLKSLRLFEVLTGMLQKSAGGAVEEDLILEQLAMVLPNEDTEGLLETVVAWGRFGELIGYDAQDGMVRLEAA
jgi:NitT/TauT family transport system ATP-binding protein